MNKKITLKTKDRIYSINIEPNSIVKNLNNNRIIIILLKQLDKEIEKIRTGELDILYGSQSIFGEGISVNELSALVLATPINNEPLLIQLIGRIIRKLEGKQQPVVVDIHLKGNTASRQARARSAVYIKQGYDIQVVAN
mgnify:CR=1 FL=1